MIADRNIVVDGQHYEKGEEIWDLGSLIATEVNGNQRTYIGFLEDAKKLPKYNDLASGSTAILIDPAGTEETIVLSYHSKTQTWYKL